MSDWKTAKLGNLAEVQTGPFGSQLKNEQYITGGTPVVTVEHITNFLIEDFTYPSVTDEDKNRLKKYTLKAGDIVFSRVGSVDLSALVKNHQDGWLFSSRMLRVRVKEKLNTKFLSYYLRQSSVRQFIINTSVGSTMPSINTELLKNLPVVYCSLEKQKKIAAVLSSLDDKIELNNRINSELENLAKTIYDYWFVQFDFPDENGKPYKSSGGKMVYNQELKREIPAGWEVGTLSKLGDIAGGSTPSTKNPLNFCHNGTAWITPKDLSLNVGNKFISKGELDVTEPGIKEASLKIYPKGTILLSSRAPIGYMAIARNEVTTNQGFKSFIPNKRFSIPFVYYTVKNSMNAIIKQASGSTFKEVSLTTLKDNVYICLPSNIIVDFYTKKVNAIFRQQDILEQENQQLTQLRDWLLPMLMNGQITIK
ncbi:restriction endonuclease subunit S [Dolichospermum flos-aquae]|uniref:Restriction endonuclease subunit S n=1 Tax=Dolichospermum flos-aquae LEGE 04289 TaxID=1828708 RepID=A0ACC5Q2D0_DOLFA|nr:restriction endonuclease subunit S [Dolichospermum flos-aquae]MBE9219731.1 restriction endonuclease subunit S [Dolichospermum flos-aquae LEGE 04289]